MSTRGQVSRALMWADWNAMTPAKRKLVPFPRCLTCGAESTHAFVRGQPAYPCKHDAMTIDEDTMRRARDTFGR